MAVAVALAGCMTAAEREALNAEALREQLNSCQLAVRASPEFAPLRLRLPLDPAQPALEQLASGDPISEAEAAALTVSYPRLQACRRAYRERLETWATSVAILEEVDRKAEVAMIALLQGASTWAQYVQAAKQAVLDARSQLATEAKAMALEQARQAELGQIREALTSLERQNRNARQAAAARRSTTRSCTRFLNSVTCVTD